MTETSTRAPRPAPRGTHDGYGTVGSDRPFRAGARTVALESTAPMGEGAAMRALEGAVADADAHDHAVRLLEAARNRTRRAGSVTPRPLTAPITGRADDAGAWDYLTPYLTGTRAMATIATMIERVAADLGLSYARDASRAYSTGADRDDMLSDTVERAGAALRAILAREDVRPAAATAAPRRARTVKGAPVVPGGEIGTPLALADGDTATTYSADAPATDAVAWHVPRERACLACQRCTQRATGLSPWILSGCEAPVIGTDYVTPGRIVARAMRVAVRNALRAPREMGADAPDLLALEKVDATDREASPLDAYPSRARAVLVAACAAVEAHGEDYATTGGPTVALRIAVALALGETPTASGQRRAMSALRAMV